MRSKYVLILIFTALLTAACGSKKKATQGGNNEPPTTTQNRNERPSGSYADVVEEYISNFSAIAQEEMRLYNIPASITLAQGILESGAGRGELTRRANNHFGIKCHEWEGDKVYHDDDRSKECFRKYNDPKYSYRDHSLFLSERKRYSGLFDLELDDYKGWARGLRAAGYATDRQYPAKLISLIERYNLDRYDAEVLGNHTPRRNSIVQKGARIHNVQKGDTLYSIAKRYNTTVEILQRKNNLRDTNISIGQEIEVPN